MSTKPTTTKPAATPSPDAESAGATRSVPARASRGKPAEIGGPTGPEPTRYGDWERGGRCIDF